MKFFTPSPPPSSACPPTLENLPNERNTIINHRCRCRDDNRSSYSTPSPLLSNTFLRAYRISLSALWRGVNEKSRYQKKCRYLNKNKRKRKEKNRTFSPWKIEKQRTRFLSFTMKYLRDLFDTGVITDGSNYIDRLNRSCNGSRDEKLRREAVARANC